MHSCLQAGFAVFLGIATVASLPAQDAGDVPLRDLAGIAYADSTDEAFESHLASLAARKATFEQIYAELAKGSPHLRADVETGWLRLRNMCKDKVKRPFILYVPKDYRPDKRYPLIMHLHGGVSRPQCPPHEMLESLRSYWGDLAEEHDYFHLIPAGQAGAVWWDDVGSANVLAQIDRVRAKYSIDTDRIFSTGFSDGASGSYYLALTHPTRFAAFIPLNGHMAVAQVGGMQVHLANLLNKPLYIVNTDLDTLYPAKSVVPFVKALQELGGQPLWREIKGFGHDPRYLATERPKIWQWIQKQKREAHPERVTWQGTAEAPKRVHWLQVLELGETDGKAPFADANPKLDPGRVRLGVHLDQAFAGPGVRIQTVVEESAALDAGLKNGDVLLQMNGQPTSNVNQLRAVLGKAEYGASFTLRVKRGEEEFELKGAFPKVSARPAFARGKPSAAIQVTRKGNRFDVRCKNVLSFELMLSPDFVDFGKPIAVHVNGKKLHDKQVTPSVETLMQQTRRDKDPRMLYGARLVLSVK
jgi:hypothetical protein